MRRLNVVRAAVSHPLAPLPRVKRFRVKTADLGGPVAYADYGGEGPTLVLVHGLGGCHLNWMPSAAALAKNARVLAVDLLGFGRTPEFGRGHGVEAQATMLRRFLEQVVRVPAVLVGNSFGGLVALTAAARAEVAGLVLVSPALPPTSWVEPLVRSGDLSEPLRQLLHFAPGIGELAMFLKARRGGARRLFLDLLTLGTRDVTRVAPEVIEANVSMIASRMEESPLGHAQSYLDATRSMMLHLARSERVHADAAAIRAPTLILHGEHDRLVPVSFSREFAARHPSFELQVLDDVGHVPQMEDPTRFVERTTNFLERAGLASEPIEEAPSSRAA